MIFLENILFLSTKNRRGASVKNIIGILLLLTFSGLASAEYNQLVNRAQGLCLDVQGYNGASRDNVMLYACDGYSDQLWQLPSVGQWGVIKNKKQGLCLDVQGYNGASRDNVMLYACDGYSDQQWKILSSGQVLNKQKGICLDVKGVKGASRDNLMLYACDGYSDQEWDQVPSGVANVAPTVTPISPSNNTRYLTSQSVSASATASDSDGSISRVEFKLDNGGWQSDTTNPYSVNFGTLSAGSHTIYYRSLDNIGDYSLTTPSRSIMVSQPENNPPTISGVPTTEATVGQLYSFTPTKTDLDNDPLTFSITGKPSWASFSSSTGVLSGTPQARNLGTYSNIIISVTDNIITTPVSLLAFSIEVISGAPTRETIFIHTDILGTPIAETDENGEVN